MPISDENKAKIDALTYAEVLEEVMKENNSVYQGEKYNYLECRLAALNNERRKKEHEDKLEAVKSGNKIAEDANKISKRAVYYSKWAVCASLLAVALSALSLINSLLK